MTKEKRKSKLIELFYTLIPAFAVLTVLLGCFYNQGLYPFGTGTVSWCDMSQQVIPLIADLKDMLTGRSGIFLNMQNAGGMNMWAVIFFFVSSPINLLTLFVDKSDLIYFVNILLIMKLSLSAFTSMIYFRCCQKRLSPAFGIILSIGYAFCGYGMLFYQNIIWLDIMYLFPLLMLSINSLGEKGKLLPYVLTLTAMMVINYYIGYMIVLYILLFIGLFCKRYGYLEKYSQTAPRFIIGSILSAMLSSVVWLPSFSQYLSSGRTKSSQFAESGFLGNYKTTSALLMCSAFILAVVIIGITTGRPRGKKLNMHLIMLLLMIIPIFIEPVNIFWHTGSYMAFPVRYGFMTMFTAVICAGMFLQRDERRLSFVKEKKLALRIAALVGCIVSAGVYYVFLPKFINGNFDIISKYTASLWQDENSFLLLLEIFCVALLVCGLIYLMYHKGYISKEVFIVFASFMVVMESYGNISVYVTSPNKHSPQRSEYYRTFMDLSDKIEDEDLYRVKTSHKIADVNLMGAMGYRSIGHYTSLTDKDYMFTAKQLGYSSYWMEVGTYGGTEISDALMAVKYSIESNLLKKNAVYSNSDYQIVPNDYYVPFGIITDKDMSDCQKLNETVSRQNIQELIYDKLFSQNEKDRITVGYFPQSVEGLSEQFISSPCKITLTEKKGYIYYSIKVSGRQSLYFDCFDKLSNNLNEDINGSFDVYVNGFMQSQDYPSQKQNGLLYLGTFEDENVNIKLCVNKNVNCRSFGVFGVDLDKLDFAVKNISTAELNEKGGKIQGSCQAKAGQKCVLSLPYQDSLSVKINGEKVSYSKVFGDMVCFELKDGENKIEIENSPKSFYIGISISALGVICCIVYKLLSKKLKIKSCVCRISNIILMCAGALVIVLIYILPCVVKIFQI